MLRFSAATAIAVGLIAYAFCGVARADALPAFCPTSVLAPHWDATRLSRLGFAIEASGTGTVGGHLMIRTDDGWFSAAFPAEKLTAAKLHRVSGTGVVRTWNIHLSPVLFLTFPRTVRILRMWISDGVLTGDAAKSTTGGSFSCDPPQGDPLLPSPTPAPAFASTLTAGDAAPFAAAPASRDVDIVAKPTAALDTNCAHPFADASAIHVAKLVYPFVGRMPAATAIVEVVIGRDGSVLDSAIVRGSGITAYDIAALQAAEQTTYAPAYAYCRLIVSRYGFRADFKSR